MRDVDHQTRIRSGTVQGEYPERKPGPNSEGEEVPSGAMRTLRSVDQFLDLPEGAISGHIRHLVGIDDGGAGMLGAGRGTTTLSIQISRYAPPRG